MGLPWRTADRKTLDEAFRRYPAESGKCAALARVVHAVARSRDWEATGLQIRARGAAPYICPKHPKVRVWFSHTLVRTREHHVDALTGPEGCQQGEYLSSYWYYPDVLTVVEVDVAAVDPGVQDVEP